VYEVCIQSLTSPPPPAVPHARDVLQPDSNFSRFEAFHQRAKSLKRLVRDGNTGPYTVLHLLEEWRAVNQVPVAGVHPILVHAAATMRAMPAGGSNPPATSPFPKQIAWVKLGRWAVESGVTVLVGDTKNPCVCLVKSVFSSCESSAAAVFSFDAVPLHIVRYEAHVGGFVVTMPTRHGASSTFHVRDIIAFATLTPFQAPPSNFPDCSSSDYSYPYSDDTDSSSASSCDGHYGAFAPGTELVTTLHYFHFRHCW
jgi:hypothetical protein